MGNGVVRITGVSLGFLAQIVLARTLGADGYGGYTYVMSWIVLISILARFGFDNYLIKEGGHSIVQEREGWFARTMKRIRKIVLVNALTISVITLGILFFVIGPDNERFKLFAVGLAILPVMSLNIIHQSVLAAYKKLYIADVPALIIRHSVTIILLGSLYYLINGQLTAMNAMWISLIALSVSLVFSVRWATKQMADTSQADDSSEPIHSHGQLYKEASPFMLFSSSGIINQRADVLIIGMLMTNVDVGLYNAGAKLMLLFVIVSQVSKTVSKPYIAAAFGRNDYKEAEQYAFMSTVLVSVVAVVVGGLLFAFGNYALLLFGNEFPEAIIILRILIVGKLFSLLCGPVGILMLMGKHHRVASRIEMGAAITNVVLTVAMVPFFGIVGAAVATVFTWIARNIVMLVKVNQYYSINPTILNFKAFRNLNLSAFRR